MNSYAWYNNAWNYRVPINVPAGATVNSTIEVNVDFAALLTTLAVVGTFDVNSPRVVRPDDLTLSTTQEFTDTVYNGATDPAGNGRGEIKFLLQDAGATTYYLYFDIAANGPKAVNPQTPINGNFEKGVTGTQNPPGWTATKANANFDAQVRPSESPSITDASGTPTPVTTDGTPLTGAFSYLLGARTNEEAVNVSPSVTLSRTIVVPATSPGNLVLSYRIEGWDSSDDGATQWDYLRIRLVGSSTTEIVGPTYGNYVTYPFSPNKGTVQIGSKVSGYGEYNQWDMDTGGRHRSGMTLAAGSQPWFTRTFALTPYVGQAITLQITMNESTQFKSWVHIDDVEWSVVAATLGTPSAKSQPLHHIEIQHTSGAGLTCAASTLTIKACTDAAVPCVIPFAGGVNGTLSVTGAGMTVNWDGSTGGATGSGFVIPASGSVTKNVQVATAGIVTFGVASAKPTPTNVTACNFGTNSPTNNNCVFTVSTAGFIFSNGTTGSSYTIPAQVSGMATAVNALYLRAVQASTTNPAVCSPAIISQTTAVNMGYACNNPATCLAGNLATITNTTTSLATPIAPGGTSVSLNFDTNGSAPITARYDDVGQITLNANATVTPFTGATAVTLNGSSNAYVVAPHHFGFSGITSGLIKAGNNFSATVTAYNGLAPPTVTPNFGKETAPGPEGVTLTPSLVSLVGGNNPAIGNNSIPGSEFGAFGMVNDPNGVATVNNLSWGEVGLITLTANLTNGSYLGSASTATGTSGNVGRFIPHHFDTVITQPGTTYTYSGQPFTTKVTAMNFAGTPTKNYNATAGFSKDVTLSALDSTGLTANPGPGVLTPAQPAAIVPASAFASTATGAATVATPTYTFTTAKTAPTTIRVRAIDSDSVSSSDGVTEGSALIRSGRLRLSNAFGSEKSNLSLAVMAEYWTGLSWLLNTDDSFSLIPTTAVALTPAGVAGVTVLGNVTLSGGKGSIVLVKPSSGTGMVDLAINLGSGPADISCLATPHPATTGAAMPWLRSVNGSCTAPADPSARGSFGIYSPETKKTIHVRELY